MFYMQCYDCLKFFGMLINCKIQTCTCMGVAAILSVGNTVKHEVVSSV